MLRSARLLLLLAIVLILGGVGAVYLRQKSRLGKQAPPTPAALPVNTEAAQSDWVYHKYDGKRHVAEVRAKGMRQVNDPPRVELEQVELHLFKPDEVTYDRIRSAKAQLDQTNDTMYSDGEVEITMGVPVEGVPHTRLLGIRSSGVSFDVKTGRATTDRLATFSFELGEGKAVGAVYDPNLGELILKSQVELHWRGRDPKAKPMTLEAGEATYREKDSVVLLPTWSKLTRENSELNATDSIVTLKDNGIGTVIGKQASGWARYPNRRLEYSAAKLFMAFDDNNEVRQILAEENARVVSTTQTARNTSMADRLDLHFETATGESVLRETLANGHGVMESAPLARPGKATPETRRIASEFIIVRMRPGGRDVARVEAAAPGRLEFLPNRPEQRKRTLDAERMEMDYGPDNQPEAFHARKAATITEPEGRPAGDKRPPDPPQRTWSDELKAGFDSRGQMSRLEQWGDFRYEQGERKAKAEKATLEEARDLITLEKAARMWDSSGSTAANRIVLDQKSGDVSAEGDVVSTRAPDRKGQSSSMLSNDEPVNARAERMRATDHNQKIHYEGKAVAWQGANRIWGDTLDIDRTARRLHAHGGVRTQLLDRQKAAGSSGAKPPAASSFIHIEAPDLVYTEGDRLAHYTGGSHMTRPGLDVKASQIRAYLNDSKSDSSLDRAYADGRVVILRTAPDRTITATGETAEYVAREDKIVIEQGDPTLVDSVRGTTKGARLTYWTNLDKLLVNGAEKDPVRTMLKRR
jgi:lipopolysaccharide export system protein LptA